MRASTVTASIFAFSFSKQFHRFPLLWALLATASLGSWAQNVTVSKANISFGNVIVGTTSTTMAVQITNKDKSPQPLNIVTSGDFTEIDNCVGSVAGSGSCTANISFAPTLVGAISGAASIYDNSNNLLALIGLKGTGEAPVTTAPTSLSFTGGTIGTLSAAKTFNIINTTSSTVTITAITASSDYAINTGTCLTTPLAPAAICTVNVQVQPTSVKDNGAIIITDNAPSGLPLVVKLTSVATGGPTTPISLNKSNLTFQAVVSGVSAAQTITVTNRSVSAVPLVTISASNDYGIVNNTCPASLAVKGTCTFGITFNPAFVGTIEGTAAVAYSGNNSPQVVNLTGTAGAPLAFAPTKLTFTSQVPGTTSAPKSVMIVNNSESAVTLGSVVTSGDFGIQASGTTCSLAGGTLAASSNCVIQIQFSPINSGSIVGSLTITNSASAEPLLVPLSGSASTAPGTLAISVIDLPAGTNAAILVTGPNGYSKQVTASAILHNIALGTYTLSARSVHFGNYSYLPTTTSVSVSVTTSTTANVVIDYYNVLPDTTKVLDAVGLATLLLGADQSTLIITGQSTVAQSLQPGDVLVLGSSTAIPTGKIVRVNAVALSAGWFIVLNSPATLMDAFQQFKMSAAQQLDSDAITNVTSTARGVTIFRKPKNHKNIKWNGQFSDPCADQSVVISRMVDTPLSEDPNNPLNNVTLSGTLEFCPSLVAGLDLGFFKINSAHFEADLGEYADITATLGAAGSFDKAEIKLFEADYPTIPVDVLGVPIPVTPVVSFYAGASGSASASLSVEATQSATLQAGFDYTNGVVTPIDTYTGNVSAAGPPQFQATAQIKGYVRAEIDADIAYGALSPYVSVNPYVQATVDVTADPWWTINYGVDGELGIQGYLLSWLDQDPSWSTGILGPYQALQAPGPFAPTPAIISNIVPPQPISASSAQAVSLTGSNLSSTTAAVLCSAGACNTLTPTSVTSSSVALSAVLTPGKWTAQVEGSGSTSNILSFTVYPVPTGVSITGLSSNKLQIMSSPQPISFVGIGFESGAQVTLCFANLCLSPLIAQVSTDGDNASIVATLDRAGLWTAQVGNPDGSGTTPFSFNVTGPLSATIDPTGGLINSTNFNASGSGATPNGTIILTETRPGGSPLLFNITANGQGNFTYGPFTEPSQGAYTIVFSDTTTGATSPPLTIVISSGINAQISPSTGMVNSTPFTVSGWGATPAATIRSTVVLPDNTSQNTITTANSSGNFIFGPLPMTEVGTYSAVYTDTVTSGMTAPLTWTVFSAGSLQALVTPTSGVVNSASFALSGKGASSNGGVTAHVTDPDNTSHVYHSLASSGGTFTFLPIIETVSGNYAAVISDDQTGAQSALIGWTVNPNSGTKLRTISVTPTSWTPVFAPGSATVSVMPLIIAGATGGAFNGTISSNQPWLLVDGHSSESWTAPENIVMNLNPTGLASGSHSAVLTITSSSASNSPVKIPVTAEVRQPLQVITTSIPDVLGGVNYTFQFSAAGGTGTGYKWTLEDGYLPYGISLDSNTGVMSGTAIFASNTQSLPFSVQVEDSSGADASATFSVTYRPGLIVLPYSPSNFEFFVGSSGFSLTIPTGGGVPPITLTATGMPPGLILNTSTGLITGTPTKPGNYPVTFTAQDSKSDTGSATLVLVVNLIPLKITTPTLPTAQVSTPYQQNVNGSGGSQTGFVWSIQGSLPPGLQEATNTGCTTCSLQIYGTPTAAGSYPIAVALTDSLGDTVSQSMTVIVASGAPPQLPAVVLPLATIGAPFSYTFTPTGGTAPYTLSFNGNGPDPGLQLSTTGTLSGIPTIASACSTGNSSPWYGSAPANTFQVKVTDANSQTAIQQFCLGTYYPTPVVTGVTPSPITADGSAHVLTIAGSSFRNNSSVFLVGGAALSTQFIDSNHLTVTLLPSTNALFAVNQSSGSQVLLGAGSPYLWVVQPVAYVSNENFGFTIADPPPTITSISAVLNNTNEPCTSNLLCQLVVSGTGFVFDTQYQITNPSTGLTRAVWPNTAPPWNSITTSAFSVPSAGTYTVVVSTPNQVGGGMSTAQGQFTISQ
jgi:Putative Ig domain